ncbi:MAG: NPCBM/NEW2 domain-containing protein [Tepidisphaeraceae bacterium]
MNWFRSLGLPCSVCGVVLLAASAARAEEPWTLTTADFKTSSVTLSAMDQAAVSVVENGAARRVPLDAIVQLSRGDAGESVKGLVLCVAGGERLVGTPKKLDGQNLVWFTSGAGDVRVPIEQTLGVLRDRLDQPGLSADRTEDTAKLATGDSVHGIVTDVTAQGFTITPAAGDAANVAVEAVTSLLFASPPGGRKAVAPAPFAVHLAGGSVIAMKGVTVSDGTLTGTPMIGDALKIPMDQVSGIENTAGPVRWLSARTPVESVYTPFLSGHFTPRMDRTVLGRPIRFEGTTYARGIGVHSRTRLTFAIEPGDQSFRTQYAIDDDLRDANVDVRILVDGAVVHEAKGFHAGVMSPVVTADVSHAKRLTLEVDYGQGYDVQDRLNWIEPAILRAAPASASATQP